MKPRSTDCEAKLRHRADMRSIVEAQIEVERPGRGGQHHKTVFISIHATAVAERQAVARQGN